MATPLQYSGLENPLGGGAWWAAIRGVAKSWTWLSNFTFTFHFHALEKEMATHSSVLAWRTPGMGEPDRLPSMGSHRVRHDLSSSSSSHLIWEWSSKNVSGEAEWRQRIPPFFKLIWRIFVRYYVWGTELDADIVTVLKLMVWERENNNKTKLWEKL